MNIQGKEIRSYETEQIADLVLDIGTYLLASGAHCGRICRNIRRMTDVWGYNLELNPDFTGLLITIRKKDNSEAPISSFKKSPPHNVNLGVLTELSHLSWKVYEKDLSVEDVVSEFEKIKNRKTYSPWLVTLAVGFACAGLCLFYGGDYLNASIAFAASFVGYLFRVLITRLLFNPMIAISIAAFVSTLIASLGYIFSIGQNPEAAMATAVLYLIPGVPLINCVIDLIEGYLNSAINRMLYGAFILLCIAAGMTLCITLIGINNF